MVWTGDTVLYVSQGESGPWKSVAAMGSVLGLTEDRAVWVRDPVQLTDAGKRWGLEHPGSGIRGARADEATLVLSGNAKRNCAATWLKTTNPRYPLSGMIASCFVLSPANGAALRDFYRLALFTGEPVTLPRVSKEPVRQVLTARIVTRAGRVARRAVLRGETVQLTVEVSGKGHGGGPIQARVRVTGGAPSMRHYDLAAQGVGESVEQLRAYASRGPGIEAIVERALAVTPQPGQAVASEPVELRTASMAVDDYEVSLKAYQELAKKKPEALDQKTVDTATQKLLAAQKALLKAFPQIKFVSE